jgi:hypothetical protein
MRCQQVLIAPLILTMASCGSSGSGGGGAMTVPNPTVEGPVTGGRGVPWISATNFDPAEVGYAQEEFFFSGTARAYTNVGPLGSDGAWEAELAGSASYRSRIVVYRPVDPARFNGSVVIEWLNVSGGIDAAPDWVSMHTELTREGYAWVGVSAQLAGIEGGGGFAGFNLKAVDPERYASLDHPGDSFSYDIFSQASQAVLRPQGLDPLGGLPTERLIAVGESQSAFRLTTYVNAIHPLVRLHDGFLIHSRGGGSAALSEAPEPEVATPEVVYVREDLDEPVLTFQTETDLIMLGYLSDRQPDGRNFRLWEVAGTAHADTYTVIVGFGDKGDTPVGAELLVTSQPVPGIIECATPINSGPQHFVLKAAIAALDAWIRGEGAPPMAPRLEVEGSPPSFVLDELGNVRGGIRTPAVDAPIATLSGLGQTGANFCRLFGTTVPFDAETLAALYPDQAAYVAAVTASADAAVAAGFIRPADAVLIKQAAAEFDLGG